MTRCVTGHEAVQPLDLVVANAGISAGTRKLGNAPWADDREVFAVNVNGVANPVEPAPELMRARHAPDRGGLRGPIALIASLASTHPFPPAPATCPSKHPRRVSGG